MNVFRRTRFRRNDMPPINIIGTANFTEHKRGRGRPSKIVPDGVVELYAGGKTLQEIGDAHGLTRERVRQILEKAGVRHEKNNQSAVVAKTRKEKGARLKSLIESLAKQGMNRKQIAAVIGYKSLTSVHKNSSVDASIMLNETARKEKSIDTIASFNSPGFSNRFRKALVDGWQD